LKKETSKFLKSVSIRFKKRQKRLLITKDAIPFFETFLKESIGNEVVVINTNIGLGVYYASPKDYSNVIKKSVLVYALKYDNSEELIFLYDLNYDTLKINFSKALFTFANYPQLFLAYVKKFVHLRNQNSKSKIVMPELDNLYEQALKELYQKNKLPFAEKIMSIDGKFFKERKDSILSILAKKLNTKEHLN